MLQAIWPVSVFVAGSTYLHMYTGSRDRRGGWFVECGLILMGTDDKQRKQASSLPGEICLLLLACSGAIHGGNVASLSSSIFHPRASQPPQRPSWFDAALAV